MKQEERRRNTIRLLMDTTTALIRLKGCHSLTMKDIMDNSGLSKGAIFHYVGSKDEIFIWVLEEQLEETHKRFLAEVASEEQTFAGPMQAIADGIALYDNERNVTNQVLMYLLGREERPAIAEALGRYYDKCVQMSAEWIQTGQKHGVIPESVDAVKTADMFVLLTFGLRMRSGIPKGAAAFTGQDLSAFISSLLQAGSVKEEKGGRS